MIELVVSTEAGELRVPVQIVHRYTSRDTESYGGGDHVMVSSHFKVGRIRRIPGDMLCLWRAKSRTGCFDTVEPTRKPTCKKCLEVLHRLGASLDVIGDQS